MNRDALPFKIGCALLIGALAVPVFDQTVWTVLWKMSAGTFPPSFRWDIDPLTRLPWIVARTLSGAALAPLVALAVERFGVRARSWEIGGAVGGGLAAFDWFMVVPMLPAWLSPIEIFAAVPGGRIGVFDRFLLMLPASFPRIAIGIAWGIGTAVVYALLTGRSSPIAAPADPVHVSPLRKLVAIPLRWGLALPAGLVAYVAAYVASATILSLPTSTFPTWLAAAFATFVATYVAVAVAACRFWRAAVWVFGALATALTFLFIVFSMTVSGPAQAARFVDVATSIAGCVCAYFCLRLRRDPAQG